MTLEIKARCLSKELRDEISSIFERKKKKGDLSRDEEMFWFIIEEMDICPQYEKEK